MGKLLIDERPLTVLPSLVAAVGMERAVILQQIHWLLQSPKSGVDHEGEHWVWGSYDEWCADFFPFWSAESLRKHIIKLEREGYVISAQIKGFDRRKAYRINQEKIDGIEVAKREDVTASMREDVTASKRKNFHHPKREDVTAWNREDVTASIREDVTDLKREDVTASYITETSTENSTKTSAEREIAADAAPALPAWPEYLAAFCWICHGHKEIDALTEKQRGILLSEAQRTRDDGYSVDDLREWFRDVWQKDWRWTHKKKHERPTPSDVRSMIPAIRDPEQADTHGKYSLDVPGIVELSPLASRNGNGHAPASLPAPMPHDDPWAIALAELAPTLPEAAAADLVGSHMEEIGQQDGKTLCRITVGARAAAGLEWLRAQAEFNIRRKLGSVLGKLVQIEIVAGEPEGEVAP